jgi:uncharacterized protein YoxC
MNAGQLAALIAAVFFAVLACAGIFVLVKLSRLMSAVTGMVSEYRDRADLLIRQAQEAVDRTNEQLARTDAITASMDQVTANMAELTGHVSALTGLARGLSVAAAAPLHGASAFVFGLRRAVAVRRSLQVAAMAETIPAALVGPGKVVPPAAPAIASTAGPGRSGPAPARSRAVPARGSASRKGGSAPGAASSTGATSSGVTGTGATSSGVTGTGATGSRASRAGRR